MMRSIQRELNDFFGKKGLMDRRRVMKNKN